MNRNRWLLVAGLAVLLVGGILVVYYLLNRPMSQALTLTTPTAEATQELVQQSPDETPSTKEESPTAVATAPEPTPTTALEEVSTICGNTGTMRMLVIGLTLPTDVEVLGADAIRLVTLDFDQPSATIMSMPARLWVKTPTLLDQGVEESELAAVYFLAYEGKKLSSERLRHQLATQAVAQTIIDNFGFVPDHYLVVDERTFVEAVDTLGGIEIDLPEAVDGTSEEYGTYPAGKQRLDGLRALNFARLFHPSGLEAYDTWGNMGRQKLIVQAILAETMKPQNFTKIPALADDLLRGLVTDLSIKQALDVACMVEAVGQSTQILGLSEEMATWDDNWRLVPDLDAIRQLVQDMSSN